MNRILVAFVFLVLGVVGTVAQAKIYYYKSRGKFYKIKDGQANRYKYLYEKKRGVFKYMPRIKGAKSKPIKTSEATANTRKTSNESVSPNFQFSGALALIKDRSDSLIGTDKRGDLYTGFELAFSYRLYETQAFSFHTGVFYTSGNNSDALKKDLSLNKAVLKTTAFGIHFKLGRSFYMDTIVFRPFFYGAVSRGNQRSVGEGAALNFVNKGSFIRLSYGFGAEFEMASGFNPFFVYKLNHSTFDSDAIGITPDSDMEEDIVLFGLGYWF